MAQLRKSGTGIWDPGSVSAFQNSAVQAGKHQRMIPRPAASSSGQERMISPCFPDFLPSSLSLFSLLLSLTSCVSLLFFSQFFPFFLCVSLSEGGNKFMFQFHEQKVLRMECIFLVVTGFHILQQKRPFPLETQRWSCCKRRKPDRPASAGRPPAHTRQTVTCRVCMEEPQILEALLPKHKHFPFFFFFSQREIKTLITADALLPNCAKQNKY